MIKRVVDISNRAYVHMRHRQLLIKRDDELIGSIPIEDLGILILQHPAIVITQAVIIACQQNNVIVVFCDAQHLPYSVILPISDGHTLHTRILQDQIQLKPTTRKRLWKEIVQQKITEQARTLDLLHKNSEPVKRLIKKVKTGDKENHESQAAQKYWKILMGQDFRRNPKEGEVNVLLNYGYAIMRAMIARAIVGSGLHPAIGLHHKNQYNGLCLADDLMEPFRPWVDYYVYELMQKDDLSINPQNKQLFLGLLSKSTLWKNKTLPLMTACHSLTAHLKSIYVDQKKSIIYPELASRLNKIL